MEGEVGLIAVVGEEALVTAWLLTGIGTSAVPNYFAVGANTHRTEIEAVIEEWVERQDIAVILVSQTVADDQLSDFLAKHQDTRTIIITIPGIESKYSPSKDFFLRELSKQLFT